MSQHKPIRVSPKRGRSKSTAFSVLSYNINFGSFLPEEADSEAPTAAHRVVEACLDSQADILLLQETNDGWEEFFREHFVTATGFEDSWLSPNDYGFYAAGSAVLVNPERFKLLEVVACPTSSQVVGSYFDQMLVWLEDKANGRKFAILNLHLRPPLSMGEEGNGLLNNASVYLYKASSIHGQELAFCSRLCLDRFGVQPTLIVGDFNEGSGGAVRAAAELGLCDVARGKAATWHWPLKFGLKLFGWYDHIFYNPQELGERSSKVLEEFRDASDHVPVLASLAWQVK